jgi:hypothetical protein
MIPPPKPIKYVAQFSQDGFNVLPEYTAVSTSPLSAISAGDYIYLKRMNVEGWTAFGRVKGVLHDINEGNEGYILHRIHVCFSFVDDKDVGGIP